MKVYVVQMDYDYEGSELRGVFSTEEKAMAFLETLGSGVCYGPDVEEWEVDGKCE